MMMTFEKKNQQHFVLILILSVILSVGVIVSVSVIVSVIMTVATFVTITIITTPNIYLHLQLQQISNLKSQIQQIPNPANPKSRKTPNSSHQRNAPRPREEVSTQITTTTSKKKKEKRKK